MSPLDLKHPQPDLLCSSHTPNVLHSWTEFDRCAIKLLSCICSSFQDTQVKIVRGLGLQGLRVRWALLPAATPFHIHFVAMLPKGKKTAWCGGLLKHEQKEVVTVSHCGTHPGRASLPLPAVTNMSLPQKELLTSLGIRGRTLEALIVSCDRRPVWGERQVCEGVLAEEGRDEA